MRSGGNPFFAEELVQAWVEEHEAISRARSRDLAGVRAIEIPRSVRATIRQRIERLPTSARDLLATASVLGVEFGARLLGQVAELPGRQTRQVNQELLQLDLAGEPTDAHRRVHAPLFSSA
jgi:predicted ATPase